MNQKMKNLSVDLGLEAGSLVGDVFYMYATDQNIKKFKDTFVLEDILLLYLYFPCQRLVVVTEIE